MRRHNLIVECLALLLCNTYGLTTSKRVRNHSIQKTMSNEDAEVRVDTRIKTDVRIQRNTIVIDKKRRLITIIEVGVTNQDFDSRI